MKGEEILNFLTSLAEGISAMFGPDCEVIIHDLKKKGSSNCYLQRSCYRKKKRR